MFPIQLIQVLEIKMLENDSMNFGADESLHIENPSKANNFSNLNYYKNDNTKPNMQPVKCLNVLYPHKSTGKLTVNSEFEEMLASDQSAAGLVPVSVLGTKKIGKSFLLDNILSLESGETRRVMSKNRQDLINSTSLTPFAQSGGRIIYLDNNGDPSPSIFLWLYSVSSLMIYNLSPVNSNEENMLLECVMYVFNSMRPNELHFSRPRLILLRRDADKKQIFDFDLVRKLEQFDIFEPSILVLHMPYPGSSAKVMAKELLDVPPISLDNRFINEAIKLQRLIHMCPPKQAGNHQLSAQSLSLMLAPLTKSINNQEPVSADKMLSHVHEALAINYYNNYLKAYSAQLEKELSSEQPYDKYSLYQKLSRTRSRVNKKMEKHCPTSDHHIYAKYKEKLDSTIASKETLVKKVNQAKSREAHERNYQLLEQHLNANNYEQFIDNYCKSELDDQKTEVLLENLQKIVRNRGALPPLQKAPPVEPSKPALVMTSKPVTVKAPPPQLAQLDKELEEIGKYISLKSKSFPQKSNNAQSYIDSIKQKKKQLLNLREEHEKLAQAVSSEQVPSSQVHSDHIVQMENEREKLMADIEKNHLQIQEIKKLKQSKLKETTVRLENELRQQQLALQALKSTIPKQSAYQSRVATAGKSSTKTCCQIM